MANIWRRDVGLAVGHVGAGAAPAAICRCARRPTARASPSRARRPATLAPGQSLSTDRTFICRAHRRSLRAARRSTGASSSRKASSRRKAPESAFAPIWCAWGYEREFTVEQIVATLPKVRELGFEWAVLDDGWQNNEGDWHVDTAQVPARRRRHARLREADPRAGPAPAPVDRAARGRSGQRRAARSRRHAAARPVGLVPDGELVERAHAMPRLSTHHRLLRRAHEEDHRRLGLRRPQARRPASELRGALLQQGAPARASRPTRSRS